MLTCFLSCAQEVRHDPIWAWNQLGELPVERVGPVSYTHLDVYKRQVLQIVGNGRESVPVADADIETLRASVTARLAQPYSDLVIGEKVRVKSGILQGVQGTLVRRSGGDRFVLSFESINQHAAIQVSAEDLEPVRT